MDVESQIKDCLIELPKNYQDPTWLSNCSVTLSTLLYNLGDLMSDAKLAEEQAAVRFMDMLPEEGAKKMSATEAEKRAIVETSNRYERYRRQYESVVEVIQSVKKKLDLSNQLIKLGA